MPTSRYKTKPRTPLNKLAAEWHVAGPGRRRSIEAHWPRSVRAFLAAFIEQAPGGIWSATQDNMLRSMFHDEMVAYFDPPFQSPAAEAIPFERYNADRSGVKRLLFDDALSCGGLKFSDGPTWETNTGFPAAWSLNLVCLTYESAWAQRHRESPHDEIPAEMLYNQHDVNETWTARDYEIRLTDELTAENNIARNIRDTAAAGYPYKPRYYRPRLCDIMDGRKPLPEMPPEIPPLQLPVGPNGRRIRREILTDDGGELYYRLVEMTEEEEANTPGPNHIFTHPYDTLKISPRAYSANWCIENGMPWLVDQLSDEVVTYYTDENYGKEAAARDAAAEARDPTVE